MPWNDGSWSERRCVVCGKTFVPKVATQLTCSKECGKIHNRIQQKERDEESKAYRVKHGHINRMDEIREIAKKGIHYGLLVVEMEKNGNQM